jgi:hypothetical protein
MALLAGSVGAIVVLVLGIVIVRSLGSDDNTATTSTASGPPPSPTVASTIELEDITLYDLAAGVDSVWFTHSTDGIAGLSELDLDTRNVVSQSIKDCDPHHPVVEAGSLWVVCREDDSLRRLDAATGTPIATTELRSETDALAATADAVWVLHDDEISRVDPATNEVVSTVPVSGAISDIAATTAGAWAVGSDGRVWRVDPSTNELERVTSLEFTADEPEVMIAATEWRVWVAYGDYREVNRLAAIDGLTGQTMTTLDLGAGTTATDLAAGASAVFVVGERVEQSRSEGGSDTTPRRSTTTVAGWHGESRDLQRGVVIAIDAAANEVSSALYVDVLPLGVSLSLTGRTAFVGSSSEIVEISY